nr:hypothetical protein [Thioalkalivibrio sp.]
MKRRRWRWRKTRVIIEATIIGATVALLIILFAESRFDRQQDAQVVFERVVPS